MRRGAYGPSEFDFINWRVVSYYMQDEPLDVLSDNVPTHHAGRLRLAKGMNVEHLSETVIRIPRAGRVVWIMQPHGWFHRALEQYLPVRSGRYICYSDIPPGMGPFEIDGFQFVPQ